MLRILHQFKKLARQLLDARYGAVENCSGSLAENSAISEI